MQRLINAPGVLIAVALGIFLAYQSFGQRAVAPAPPVVAAVQIDRLFDGLERRAKAKVDIGTRERDIQDERRQREEEIKALEQSLENTIATGTRSELMDQIGLKQLQLEYWFRESVAELELEKALRLQDLYRAIREAIAALAATEGYDIVIVNDSSDELPFERDARVSPQVQILQQIASRKLLYINDAIDITQDLIVRMNNQFRAGP